MAGISFTGIGSGLQVGEIVGAIVNAEKVPFESRISRQQGAYTTDISAVGALKSALEDVNSAFDDLADIDKYQQRTINGRDDFVGLSSDKDAEVGAYSVKVDALASNHKLMSSAIAADEAVGEGTLSISSGENSFDILVANTATLSEIRDQINDSVENESVSATIITDASGQHLVLSSKETGLDNAITIAVDDTGDTNNTDALGLSRLAFDASNKLTSTNGFADVDVDTAGSGTLSFSSDVNSFDISVAVTDTITDIMNAINNSADNDSIVARIENDGTDDHLVFSSRASGAANAITITATDDDLNDTDGLGLSQFASANLVASANVENIDEVDAASDAKITIDGTITVTNSTNVFSDVIDGVEITANKIHGVDDDLSQIAVSENNKNVAAGLNTFIEKFNALADLSTQLGKSGEDGAGALAGDSLLRGVMTKIRSQFHQEFDVGNGESLSLAQLGIRTERNGHLSLDKDTLDDLLASNPNKVQNFLIGADAESGFVNTMKEFVGFYTDSDGLIQKRIDGKNNQIDRLDKDLEKFTEKMDSLEARLFAQYNAMDLLVSQMNSTSSYLMAQLDNLPGVVKKSK